MIGPFELALIGIGALLVFGPSRLPKVGRTLGQTIKGFTSELRNGISEDDGKRSAEDQLAEDLKRGDDDGCSDVADAGDLARRDGRAGR